MAKLKTKQSAPDKAIDLDIPPVAESAAPAAEITQEHAAAGWPEAAPTDAEEVAPAPESDADTPAITALAVTSKREGFRRAGRRWSVAPTTVPIAELTDEQVAMLYAEPMLDITAVAAE